MFIFLFFDHYNNVNIYFITDKNGEKQVATLVGLVESGESGVHITFVDPVSTNKEINLIKTQVENLSNNQKYLFLHLFQSKKQKNRTDCF